ncbi:AfsR/SARP family transcriptional regulator [Solihabitans fulvus]|uniref:AfsR/SARP family transcriptional regulator n=1 Tax=Solihabitans fulvus TaxID=1892852 RepID=UPI001661C027|nr:BTAD domain-containing putative transcriptional regulator [Solihabitans fulvus]
MLTHTTSAGRGRQDDRPGGPGCWAVALLGPFELTDGSSVVPVTSDKQRIVLAALALLAGQPVTVEELADRLWGDRPPPSARATVHSLVMRLRRLLGAGVLRSDNRGYLLDLAPARVDALLFHQLRTAADRAAARGDHHAEADLLGRALALWRGPALADVRSETMHRVDARLWQDRRDETVERRAAVSLAVGARPDIVDELRELVAAQPLREQARALLITALHRAGRRADALAEYREARRVLVEELGVEPGPRLRQAHQDVLCDKDVHARTGSPRRQVPAELPHDVRGFTGRRAALDRLDALRDCGDGLPIAVLTGPAGVGKTALAVRWSHRVRAGFPDGQLFMDLHGDSRRPMPAADALRLLLRSLGVGAAEVPEDEQGRARLYRSLLADRRVLVVLDNAADADHVRPLLPGTGSCAVLVTGRSRLSGLVARDGARAVVVEPLSGLESVRLLADMIGADRVSAAPKAAGALARLCGRLPLALRDAGARLVADPALPLGDLVAELSGRDTHTPQELCRAAG